MDTDLGQALQYFFSEGFLSMSLYVFATALIFGIIIRWLRNLY